MKSEPVLAATAAAIVLAVSAGQHPYFPNPADALTPVLRPVEPQHSDHTELDAVEAANAARTERELRPVEAPMPIQDDAFMFENPAEDEWQPQPQYWGSLLPLMAGWSGDGWSS
jgi:hypothetical protein